MKNVVQKIALVIAIFVFAVAAFSPWWAPLLFIEKWDFSSEYVIGGVLVETALIGFAYLCVLYFYEITDAMVIVVFRKADEGVATPLAWAFVALAIIGVVRYLYAIGSISADLGMFWASFAAALAPILTFFALGFIALILAPFRAD